ncbi:MAG: phage terminase small subunit P27 family [Terriglobales bacterium]
MRGRKPKPTSRQIAEGDPRKKGKGKLRERLASEPNATRGLPPCPRHLRGRGRAAWKFWSAELADMQLDNRPDAMMLEGACVNYARAVAADLIVEREGMIVTESYVNDEGEIIPLKQKYHPAITVSNSAWRQVRAFCSEFGLSPVSRTRLSIEKREKPEDDLATLLSQPRQPRQTVQ